MAKINNGKLLTCRSYRMITLQQLIFFFDQDVTQLYGPFVANVGHNAVRVESLIETLSSSDAAVSLLCEPSERDSLPFRDHLLLQPAKRPPQFTEVPMASPSLALSYVYQINWFVSPSRDYATPVMSTFLSGRIIAVTEEDWDYEIQCFCVTYIYTLSCVLIGTLEAFQAG